MCAGRGAGVRDGMTLGQVFVSSMNGWMSNDKDGTTRHIGSPGEWLFHGTVRTSLARVWTLPAEDAADDSKHEWRRIRQQAVAPMAVAGSIGGQNAQKDG